ncbi:MAG TPA: hypothetical protein VMV44_08145 [Rectinemataceae bacterium]|nr:hypothetical protein [Rectinemataceae bacterium]
MSDDMDPEIAALLGGGIGKVSPGAKSGPAMQMAGQSGPSTPDFDTLFGELDAGGESHGRGEFGVDLSKKGFPTVAKFESDKPVDYFADPEFYKKALANEGEEAQKVHELLAKFLKTADPKDRGIYRQQLISSWWYLAAKVALHSIPSTAALPKKLLVRFGTLLPTALTPEQKEMIGKIVFEKEYDEPIYYVDEWIKAVATGQIKASSTDEVKTSRGDDKSKINASLQKAQGKRDAIEGILKTKAEERKNLESALVSRIDLIRTHNSQPGLLHVPAPYTEEQKKTASEVMDILRKMMAADKALAQSIGEFQDASEELEAVMDKAKDLGGDSKADLQTVAQEFETVKQMLKMSIGRQGNHFPMLMKEYFHGSIRDVATRENVIKILGWIESVDVQAFMRPYKNALNRIVPFIILVPCYGDTGVCWEPFDRFNRASSRGRVAIPLYPKNLNEAVLYAVADLRWQVAKEKASYYWMEEGLTGNYYQWFTAKKIKGDVKEFFIQDYMIWVTKESEGIQKLDKEVRAFFWRLMPFSPAIKEKLKTRSYVYQELYQKDVNRSMSDGY